MSAAGVVTSQADVGDAEVVVVGAGPSGSVAAATLAELGRDVLVVDQSKFPRDKPCGDGLTHSAVVMLEELGLRSLVEEGQRVEDCRIVVGHGAERKGWYQPPAREPRSRFMRTVPRRTLDLALLDAALERGARFKRARVDGPVFEGGAARGVRLSDADGGGWIGARAVIGADGATSRMRRESGIGGERSGPSVYAVRQYFTTTESLDPVFDVYVPLTYEGGLLAGYGWVFPIADRRANIGVAYYSPPTGRPRARIREVLSAFTEELRDRESDRLGSLSEPSPPFGAPIAVQFSADGCQRENLILCGEAALAADPLTGEGISFAMGSGRAAAHVADGVLRSTRTPQVGRLVGRRFPRLGQNLGLLARIGVGAADGFKLAEGEQQSMVQAVRRVTAGPPEEPSNETTDVRELLSRDAACADALDRVNERLLDSLQTSFPFGFETLEREVRAGGGPVAAACAIGVARACRDDLGEATIAVAASAELVALVDRCLPRLSSRVDSDIAWLNNAMALLLGDLALTAALRTTPAAHARFAREIGAAIQRIAEGEMVDAEDRFDVERTVERCGTALDARAGTFMSLAARLGALAAGMAGELDSWARFGRELGVAYQISEEIRELTLGDEPTRKRPGSDLRAGIYTLPVVIALHADDELRDELGGPLGGRSVPSVVARIEHTGALTEALTEVRRHSQSALDAVRPASQDAEGLPTTLAAFPMARVDALVAGLKTEVAAPR